jgi:hypothetical protein
MAGAAIPFAGSSTSGAGTIHEGPNGSLIPGFNSRQAIAIAPIQGVS